MPPILLLADASLTIRRVIELTFADENVRVVAVGDGGEAIARIEAEPPDIVLADIGMPAPNGYEVAEFVKRHPRFAHIPVLLLTGAFEPIDAGRAGAIGCEGVLVKPFEPQLVISRVRELLKGGGGTAEGAASLVAERRVAPVIPAGGDEYFERLDAAFAAMGSAPPPAGTVPPQKAARAPDGRPAEPNRPAPAGVPRPSSSEATPPPSPISLASAFSALLTAERGQVFTPGEVSAASLPPSVIDEIATRVIARLGDAVMRQAVLDAAERLVGEEIERIKSAR